MSADPSANPGAIGPPPLPNQAPDWYFVQSGTRKGPVSRSALQNLLLEKQIDAETPIWRAGMADWKSVRESDLADLVRTSPPAVAGQLIGNTFVWILALLPLVIGVIDASIAYENRRALIWSGISGAPLRSIREVPIAIPFALNVLFGLLDERNLRKAGHSSRFMPVLAGLLVPVYLFVRAKRVKQRPTYAITWIVSFILAVIFVAAAEG